MNPLGWMRAPEESLAQWGEHTALAAAVRRDGLTRTLVCGMGGSSLVADVLAETFGAKSLHVLDSTNPDAVRAAGTDPDLARTLFVISSKSGNTVETLAFCHYFAARARPEQFIAESSGKDGRGVVPIVQDPAGGALPDSQTAGPEVFSADPLDLGAEFLRWEYATAALCDRLGVNAFDQPDVEEAKRLARAELTGGGAQHAAPLPTLTPAQLRQQARPRDYFAILAYVPPTPQVLAQLQKLRAAWGEALGCSTTLGIGPRYLHSTGQLHKGGPNSGLFLVITSDVGEDLDIPEMGWTFGQLHHAQARGDVRALLARGRRVAHVHLSSLAEISRLRPLT